MDSENENVPQDAELVSRVIYEHDVTPKGLAMDSHRHISQIYHFLSGAKTLPSDVLRSAFKLTGDLRIPGLIIGEVPVFYVHPIQVDNKPGCPKAQPVRTPPINELTTMSCKAVELMASSTRYLCKALADGKMDTSDRHDLECHKKTVSEAMRCHALLVAAVEVEMRKAGI